MSLGPRGNGRVSIVHTYDMCNVSYVCYNTSTCIPLCRYNHFLICLGTVRPMQVDGIWDRRHLAYNKYMASLLPGEIYYRLQRLLRTDVRDLIEECNATSSAAWEIGGAVCGGEAVVPIVVVDAWGYGNTLPASPILRASNYTSLRTMGGATSSTSTSTPGVAARSAALGHVAASTTLRVSCVYGR